MHHIVSDVRFVFILNIVYHKQKFLLAREFCAAVTVIALSDGLINPRTINLDRD